MRALHALAGLGVAWCGPALAPHAPALAQALGIARTVRAAGVALTFDDGPHPQGTPAVLSALDARGARATFFLVGEQVVRRPALAREIVAAGHTVALHGNRHRNLLRVAPRALGEDLRQAVSAIGEATGEAVTLYRPPYGIFSAAALSLARHARWTPLLWSRWGRDWSLSSSAEQIASRATREIALGDVVLLHDADYYSEPGSWRNTVRALPRILDELETRELRTVSAGERGT